MSLSVKQFIQELAESGLMSEADIQTLGETAPAGDQPADDFAAGLVESGRLTRFQAKALLEGDGRRLVLGNYVVLERIGAGGMGLVLKAEHRRMKRRVALKMLPKAATESDSLIKRFHREVEAAARLSHPNIVTAHDADESRGVHFLVMEYVDGSDLSSLVKRQGTLPITAALDCVLQAARGLEFAHSEGVIHRDIKPSNLLLDRKGTVKVLDMGLARIDAAEINDHTDLTGTGQIMGTIDYMAPEQALDTKHADARADIYSLGATLNYLLTARPMLPGNTQGKKMQALLSTSHEQLASLQPHREDVSDELEQVFQKMVSRDPEERYQTMGEVISALQALLPAGPGDSATQPAVSDSVTQAAGGGSGLSSDSALKRFLERQDVQTTAVANMPPAVEVSAETVRSTAAEATHIVPTVEMVGATSPATRKPASRSRLRTMLPLLLVGGLIAAGVIFRIKTRDGVLLIEIPQEVAEDVTVEVDGERAEITGRDGKVVSVEVAPGRHEKLLIIVDGVRLLTDVDSGFEIDAGGELPIVARFEPNEPRPPGSGLPDAGVNYALSFDGENDYVQTPISFDGSHALTVECWTTLFNHADVGSKAIISDAEGSGISLERNNATWRFGAFDGDWWRTLWEEDQDVGNHVHLAGIYDGREVRFFINGSKVVARDGSAIDEFVASAMQIQIASNPTGSMKGSNFYRGIIDEVRISSIARYTEDFIPEERFESDENTLALYHFDEGNGEILHDSSGNGHHGEIIGAMWVRIDGDEVLPVDVPSSPRGPPAVAVAPFDAEEAQAHQLAWADHLGETVEYRNSIGMNFRLIPPGQFLMGSTAEELSTYRDDLSQPGLVNNYGLEGRLNAETPQHRIHVTQPMYFGEHEMTQADFWEVMQAAPSHFSSGGRGSEHVQGVDTDLLPVETIGWLDAAEFCNRLSVREGLTPCYEIDGDTVNWLRGDGYRLPTEAEWEFSARGRFRGEVLLRRVGGGDRGLRLDCGEFRGGDASCRFEVAESVWIA